MGDFMIQGEHFNTKIMEIDYELRRFDLSKGGYRGTELIMETKMIFNPSMGKNIEKTLNLASPLETCANSMKHTPHVPKNNSILNEANNMAEVYSAPKWERLLQTQTPEE